MNERRGRFGTWAFILFALALAVAGPLPAARAEDDKSAAPKVVFGSDRTWEVHLTIPAKEYEAMQPRGGFGGKRSG